MSYNLILIIGIIPLSIFIYMTICFLSSLYLKRTDFVDICWGSGFILVSILTLIIGFNTNIVTYITTTLVLIWGFRLSSHIFLRFRRSKEDPRYIDMKKKFEKNLLFNVYTKIFLPQGILMYIISLVVIFINVFSPDYPSTIFYIGLGIWIFGFIFESIADYQLKMFLGNKIREKKVMDEGLWKYSRHPNYFGEVTMWWGLFVISIDTMYWPITIVSPILITYLILNVSGIPLLEKRYEGDKEYEKYKKKTSIFLPLPPKR